MRISKFIAIMKLLALFYSALVLFACSDSSQNTSLEQTGLTEVVDKYYHLEMSKSWAETYEMRYQEFRNIVNKDYYIETMTKNAIGWDLISYKINTVSANKDNRIVFSMEFTYRLAPNARPHERADLEIFSLKDVSIWQHSGENWYCYNAGIQGHLPLNDSVNK